MKRVSCIFGRHCYKPSEIELYLVEKKPHSNVYRSIAKCMYCGKENEQLIEIPHWGSRKERLMDWVATILQKQELRDEVLEYCDGECDQCPYGKRIPADRGWSKAEFFKEDSWMCTLKGED